MQVTSVALKEHLEYVSYLGTSISEEREKLHTIFCQVTKTTPHLSGMPSGGSSDRDALMVSYITAKEQLAASVSRANTLIENTIVLIDESDIKLKEKKVLKYRYIMCKTWKQVAESLQLSERQVYRILDKALDGLSDYMNRKKIKL